MKGTEVFILLRDGDNLGDVFKKVPEDIDLVDISIEIEKGCECNPDIRFACPDGVLVYLVYTEKADE